MSAFTLLRRISIAAYVKPRLAQFPAETKILRDNDGECWNDDVDCDACPFGILLKYGAFGCCLHYGDDVDSILQEYTDSKRARIILSDLGVL